MKYLCVFYFKFVSLFYFNLLNLVFLFEYMVNIYFEKYEIIDDKFIIIFDKNFKSFSIFKSV